MRHNKVSSLESLCLGSLEKLVCEVSLQTSKLIIKLLPDQREIEDEREKQVLTILKVRI